MVHIRPFRGLRPKLELTSKIASKPYDVLDSEEAREELKKEPFSFLQIAKPEINFTPPINPYDDAVYEKGQEIFQQFIAKGYLVRDQEPSMYIYSQVMNGRRQTGIIAGSSIDDYFDNTIKKHELTRTAKENDRIKHMKTQMAQPGMVFLTYRKVNEIDQLVAEITKEKPLVEFTDEQHVTHQLWKISDPDTLQNIQTLFETKVPCSYIADGHHRSAASAKVGQAIRDEKGSYTGHEPFNFFLSCLFPSNQLQIIDYNRVIKDLNHHSNDEILALIGKNFDIKKAPQLYKPSKVHEFSMYLDKQWYILNAHPNTYDDTNPIQSLDVTVLSDYVLDPIFGIKDQRTDDRIDFVGGIRGLEALSRRVDQGEMAIAFAFYPVTLDQLMAIADDGLIMPPKSTWFEPKLKSGLVINLLEDISK